MITGLFETHIQVSNLESSMKFYSALPGLELAMIEQKRRIAFYWIGKRGEAMLGLWENKGIFATAAFCFPCQPRDDSENCCARSEQDEY